MVRLLQDAKRELQDKALSFPKGSFTRTMARTLKADVERVLGEFADKAARDLGLTQAEMAKLGLEFVDELVVSQARKPPVLALSPEIVENAATRSADLIRTLSTAQIGKASEIINLGVVTGKSVFEVSQELAGAFGKGLAQMETIARTEMLGIQSQVQFAQLSAMAEETKGLRKQWVSVQDERTRLGHRLSAEEGGAHLQVVPVDEPFKVPLTIVGKGGEESLGDVEDMMFPRDPNASVGNIANCRCVLLGNFEETPPLTVEELQPVEEPITGLAAEVTRALTRSERGRRA